MFTRGIIMNEEEKIREIFKRLNEVYTVRTFLDHDPYKVLVRTILSQRTRDENTDQAANALFDVYPDIYAVADAPVEEVQKLIKPAGFYRVKAGRIQEVSRILIDQY
jgi:endonuclease-3